MLLKHERFEGNGHSINLTGVSDGEGLFRVADHFNEGGPSSLKDAPVIHDVHMIGGETSVTGGFIVQSEQQHFIVKNCSSTGVIRGECPSAFGGGGGICGFKCSGDILITHCWSSGAILGHAGGGIAGMAVGHENHEDNSVTISHCYSMGKIAARVGGGICDRNAGESGMVLIKHCYSTGEIVGADSGGITGGQTANRPWSCIHYPVPFKW